jgi:putative hydrolase of the HAD superfamily
MEHPPAEPLVGQHRADVKLITLDLDETLWPLLPTLESAERQLYSWLQQHAPRITATHDFDGLKQHRLSAFRRFPDVAHDVTAVRYRLLCELCSAASYSHAVAEQALGIFLQARSDVQPFADALDFLRRAAGRYHIASLTNGNADVTRTELGEYIGFAHSAAAAGAAKPAPAMFRHAIAWAEVDPIDAVHIGDDPELDVMAARAVGMHSVWVNRTGQRWPEHLPPPDLEVTTLGCERLHTWLQLDSGVANLP